MWIKPQMMWLNNFLGIETDTPLRGSDLGEGPGGGTLAALILTPATSGLLR